MIQKFLFTRKNYRTVSFLLYLSFFLFTATNCKPIYECYIRNCEDYSVEITIFPPASFNVNAIGDSLPFRRNLNRIRYHSLYRDMTQLLPVRERRDSTRTVILPGRSVLAIDIARELSASTFSQLVVYSPSQDSVLLDTRQSSPRASGYINTSTKILGKKISVLQIGECR